MDQAVLAGVGNVYRCEVLFRHRVDPFRPGKEIRPTTWLAIWDDLVRLMPPGVAFGVGDLVVHGEDLRRGRGRGWFGGRAYRFVDRGPTQ
jgi:Formamidopyrimidine-DNA glycosylase H2TH domain